MQRMIQWAVLAAAVVSLVSCAGFDPVPEPPKPEDSFVFGHIDMEEAPVNLHWVTMRQFKPVTDKPFWHMWVKDGTFFNWYMDPGSHAVTDFGGSGYNSRYTFNIPRQLTDMRLVIKKPGIFFLGSYKYEKVKTGFFEPGKFNLVKVEKPTQKEVVLQLLEIVKGTAVEPRLRNHLEGLK